MPREPAMIELLCVAIVSWCALAFAPASAAAGDRPSPALLTVTAPERCATREAIALRVQRRSPRVVLDDTSGAPLAVTIERIGGEVQAVITFQGDTERRLSATSCADIVEAVALVIALTLDPFAELPAPAPAVTREPPSAPAQQPVPPTTSPAPAQQPAPQVEPAAEPRESTPEDHEAPSIWALDELAFGIAAGAVAGALPELTPSFVLWASAGVRGYGVLMPALRVHAQHAFETEVTEDAGVATFGLDTLGLDLCALGVRGGVSVMRACFAGSLGNLHARGQDSYLPRSYDRLWLSAGPSLRAALSLGFLQIEARLSAETTLRGYRFAFRPDVFHRVAPWVAQGQLGVGMRFP